MNYFDGAVELIKKHEGLRLKPYKCSARKLTIGYGRNLEDKGISEEEAEELLANDICECIDNLTPVIPFWSELTDQKRIVLLDMCYNLGINGLLKFKKMLIALEFGNYEKAAKEMLNSKWAKQVGNRAIELAEMMRDDK